MPGADRPELRRLQRWLDQQRRESARGSLRIMPPGIAAVGAAGVAGAREAMRAAAEEEARRAAEEAVDRTPGSGRPGRLRASLHERGHAIDVSRNLFDSIDDSTGQAEAVYHFASMGEPGAGYQVRFLDGSTVVAGMDLAPGTEVVFDSHGHARPVREGEQRHGVVVSPGQALVAAHFTIHQDGRVVQNIRQYAPEGQVNWDPPRWTEEQVRATLDRYDGMTTEWVSEHLGRWEPASSEEILDNIRRYRNQGATIPCTGADDCPLCVAGRSSEEIRAELERSGHTVPTSDEEDPMPAAATATRAILNTTWATLTQDERERLGAWLAEAAPQSSGAFLASVLRQYGQYNRMSDRQVAALVPQYNREVVVVDEPAAQPADSMQPAMTNDAEHILNGTYTVSAEGEHLTYMIYTVQRGQLQGKRVIKIQRGYGSFHGFAFLTTSGGVKVWRRFAQDETDNEQYIVWAKFLLDALNERSTDIRGGAQEVWHLDTQVQVATVCRRCNRRLTTPTSIERGIGPECEGREAGENRTVRAQETTVDPDYQEQQRLRAERIRQGRVSANRIDDMNSRVAQQINAVAGRSEVNPEEIQ